MSCCKEKQVCQVEDLKASAVGFGFDAQWVADLVQKYGDSALSVVVEAVRNGFSKELVVELLEKLGPLVLELLVNFANNLNMRKHASAAGELVVADQVLPHVDALLDASVLDVVVQKYLPLIFEKYGDKIVQLIVEWLLTTLAKK